MAEFKSSIHSEQLEDKIAKLERRNEPLIRQTPRSYTPPQNLCAKIYQYDLYWPLPTLWALLYGNWMQVGYNKKRTYKARVSYVSAYQYLLTVGQVLTPFTHPSHPISILEPGFDPGDRHTTITIPYHRSVNRPTPSRHCLKARSPWLRPNTHFQGGRKEGLISLSSLSETQERSIADKSAHVSIDQPYTLQRFYITTRSAFLADRRQLGWFRPLASLG